MKINLGMTKVSILKRTKDDKITSDCVEQCQTGSHSSDVEKNKSDKIKLRQKNSPLRWKALNWSLFILCLVVFILIHFASSKGLKMSPSCQISLVESIPIGLNYSNGSMIRHTSTYDAWMTLIDSAQNSIEIASMYWTMNRNDVYPDDSAKQGENVFAALVKAGKERNIYLKIAQSTPSKLNPSNDTEYLSKYAKAEVRSLNFTKLLGSGILHTKLWLIDRKHFYLGSANMDWRALTQVKELGIFAMNCPLIADDLAKIFDVYWLVSEKMKVPSDWPKELDTNMNMHKPLKLVLDDGNKYKTFISSSPPPFCPPGRTIDTVAVLTSISRAKKFVYVSVMDYFPLMIYESKVRYWDVIDSSLRKAALQKVHIRLLISWWKHSRKSADYFLKSLEDISGSYKGVKIEVKRFIIPLTPDEEKIPYIRVNHNKYMVTDVDAYVGTNNWSGDYFEYTGGIAMVLEDDTSNNINSLRQQLEDIFNRDWNSPYAHPVNLSI